MGLFNNLFGESMSVLVTQQAPDFTAAAVLANGSIVDGFQLSSLKVKRLCCSFIRWTSLLFVHLKF